MSPCSTLLALALLVSAGCNSATPPAHDANVDAPYDLPSEAATDVAADMSQDLARDVRGDTSEDVPDTDTLDADALDASTDLPTDVGDAALDAAADQHSDAALDASPPPYEATLDEMLCEHLSRCRYPLDSINVFRESADAAELCVALKAEQGRAWRALRPAFAAGALRYDASAAARCVERLRGVCLPFLPTTNWIALMCPGVFTGTTSLDGTCFTSFECAPGLSCSRTAGACPGVCRPQRQPGERCSVGEFCTPPAGGWGLCQSQALTGDFVCVQVQERPAVSEGGPCGIINNLPSTDRVLSPCQAGLWCSGLATPGTCRSIGRPDQPCDGPNSVCGDGHLCRGGRCTPVQLRTREGETCTPTGATLCSVRAHLVCAVSTCISTGAGTAGSRCIGGSLPLACAEGLVCRAARQYADPACQAPADVGTYCEGERDCASGRCDTSAPLAPRCAERSCF